MKIVNSFQENGNVYAIGVGSDVSYGMTVKKISVNGSVYDVKKSFAKESLIGVMQLEMLVDSKQEIPIGEATIIESEQTVKAAS